MPRGGSVASRVLSSDARCSFHIVSLATHEWNASRNLIKKKKRTNTHTTLSPRACFVHFSYFRPAVAAAHFTRFTYMQQKHFAFLLEIAIRQGPRMRWERIPHTAAHFSSAFSLSSSATHLLGSTSYLVPRLQNVRLDELLATGPWSSCHFAKKTQVGILGLTTIYYCSVCTEARPIAILARQSMQPQPAAAEPSPTKTNCASAVVGERRLLLMLAWRRKMTAPGSPKSTPSADQKRGSARSLYGRPSTWICLFAHLRPGGDGRQQQSLIPAVGTWCRHLAASRRIATTGQDLFCAGALSP